MPSDEQRALWAAIRANPLDDTPRLVYADWLQEHGDETRAEFIRVQCAIAKLGPDRRKGRKERPALEASEAGLFARHHEEWFAPFLAKLKGTRQNDPRDRWMESLPYRRGFLHADAFEVESARVLADAGDELEPVDQLKVMQYFSRHDHASVMTLTAWPGAGCVVYLGLGHASSQELTSLIHHSYMRNLYHLGMLYGDITDANLAQLAAWPFAANLRSMDLRDNPITDVGAMALIESPQKRL